MFKGNGVMLFKELSYSELAFLIFISDFICYEDCALRKGGRRNGNYLTFNDLSDYSGLKSEALKKTIYSLKKKEVIGIHDRNDCKNVKYYTVNPFIFCVGNKIKKNIVDYYADTKWADINSIMRKITSEE